MCKKKKKKKKERKKRQYNNLTLYYIIIFQVLINQCQKIYVKLNEIINKDE
jgi:hypothetical protein